MVFELHPRNVLTDFELSTINAVTNIFPGAMQKGCLLDSERSKEAIDFTNMCVFLESVQ